MLITCSNCDREIEFDRDKIQWVERIRGGYKIKERSGSSVNVVRNIV